MGFPALCLRCSVPFLDLDQSVVRGQDGQRCKVDQPGQQPIDGFKLVGNHTDGDKKREEVSFGYKAEALQESVTPVFFVLRDFMGEVA